jgi:ABC-2 type transport system permease protein
MQYKASFFMLILAHFVATFMDMIGLSIIFSRFQSVQTWTLPELAILYGTVHMGFSLAETFARGVDTFGDVIKYGEFDRILLRPLGTLFQVATREVQLMKLGRFVQGLIVCLWGCGQLKFSFLSFQSLIIIFSIIGCVGFFVGLYIIQATCSFWTTESLEIFNIATYGGVEAAPDPMSLYKTYFRHFFTFIIPLSCVIILGVMTGHEPFIKGLSLIFPLAGLLFMFVAYRAWRIGVSHYHPTGH